MDSGHAVRAFLPGDRVVCLGADAPQALAEKLGHGFSRPDLLIRALTHSSFADGAEGSNERLEFLGDRVLGLVVADMLLTRFPDEDEGSIARRFASVIDRNSLAGVAGFLELGDYLRVGNGDAQSGTREQAAVLADAMEALIGAIYRDAGLEAARGVIEPLWQPLIDAAPKPPVDAKTALQEWAQARGMALPVYRVVECTGPDHAPEFSIEVSLDGQGTGAGKGGSKRLAEQNAAADLLSRIGSGS